MAPLVKCKSRFRRNQLQTGNEGSAAFHGGAYRVHAFDAGTTIACAAMEGGATISIIVAAERSTYSHF
jgi:hypothetical protein